MIGDGTFGTSNQANSPGAIVLGLASLAPEGRRHQSSGGTRQTTLAPDRLQGVIHIMQVMNIEISWSDEGPSSGRVRAGSVLIEHLSTD